MDRILIINGIEEKCGVCQYGRRIFNIIQYSLNYKFSICEPKSEMHFLNEVIKIQPKIILYNYVPCVLPWFNKQIYETISFFGIKQALIVHNWIEAKYFKYFLHQDPYYIESENNFKLLRPLYEFSDNQIIKNDHIKIGTFGFGFKFKFFEKTCEIINKQFINEKVEIRIHATHSTFGKNSHYLRDMEKSCKDKITRENIVLKITNKFLSDLEILKFLNSNDLNVYQYEKFNTYHGLSSCIDFALSVEKPIAINKSCMFAHIHDASPSIFIEETPLKEIMKNGFGPLRNKKEEWNNKNFISNTERIIKEIINT